MNLTIFFEFLPESIIETLSENDTLGASFQFATEDNLDWQEASVAIVGVPEYRGDSDETANQSSETLLALRKQLYKLAPLSKSMEAIDLGNLRLGESPADTVLRLKEVCEMLIAHNTLPLILGGEHYLDYGQFMAYENLEKIVSILAIDAYVDLSLEEDASLNQCHIHQILVHHPNFLFEYAQLGYQRYLVAPKILKTLQKLQCDLLSVGQMRDDIKNTEPIIRAADMLSVDLAALKKPYGNSNSTPFGLSGEEASQICWYAGMNEKLSSIGFYGLHKITSATYLSSDTLAVMVWYFLEGFVHRKTEYSFKSNFHVKYIVPFAKGSTDLVFYKSKISGKWWMEVAVEEGAKDRLDRAIIVPCSYEDYLTASQGTVPDRWIKTVEKISS